MQQILHRSWVTCSSRDAHNRPSKLSMVSLPDTLKHSFAHIRSKTLSRKQPPLTGLLILAPDVLVSGTRVAGSFKCLRQAVLEERFGGAPSAKGMEGTILHELLQVGLEPVYAKVVICGILPGSSASGREGMY